MYGTVNALCARLLQEYPPDALMTLIVWTKEDVLAVLDDESVTDETAAEIVSQIPGLDGLHEYGVGEGTLWAMVENLREAAAGQRETIVPAVALQRVLRLADEFMRREDAEGGEGAAARHYPMEADALMKVRAALHN